MNIGRIQPGTLFCAWALCACATTQVGSPANGVPLKLAMDDIDADIMPALSSFDADLRSQLEERNVRGNSGTVEVTLIHTLKEKTEDIAYVELVATVRFIKGTASVKTFTHRRREGRRTFQDAARLAAIKLAPALADRISSEHRALGW
ncbi:MAG: hypothetical protein AAFY60_10170 [Myxococcota bacterium]